MGLFWGVFAIRIGFVITAGGNLSIRRRRADDLYIVNGAPQGFGNIR